ncbi:MAG TPA: oligosaccharide flippase family protein [Vicinamibacterales bacterium]|nr:oligosaccharide flippase family protein [Vicinamibacterales bacterium]
MIGRLDDTVWGEDDRQLATVARNVTTRYLSIITDAVIGLMLLPFNVHHLGTAAYGLWMLTASMTTYFSVLDLGFGGSIVKFVAHYRAKRDVQGLNEIASTLFVIFSVVGLVAYAVFVALAFNLTRVLNITPDQAATGRSLMLIIGVYVSLGFPFSIFGGIINGFQRYDLNNMVGVGSSVIVATVNVGMLWMGFSLVELVMATTSLRIIAYLIYRLNAYSVFRPLSLRPSLFRWARVRELTSFSVYISIIDWANKLNYSIDAIIIGAYLSASAVAIWTVPQRIAEMLQRMTNQVNGVLFPVVVDSDAGQKAERLRTIFIQGTRLSLVSVVPLGASLFLLATPLIHAWVGEAFDESILVTQVLILVVAVRVGNSTATTVLKGAGCHRLLAFSNAGAALGNVALSLLWIRHYGLLGQAMGTFVPVAFTSIVVLWPAACRRVGIGSGRAFLQAVWPAIWPVAVMALVVIPVRDALPARLFAVALTGAIGSLIYLATFLAFAVKRDERRSYLAKATELTRGRRRVPAAA